MGLDVEADAASAGGHNAFANAYANIHETGIAAIPDGVRVKATAVNGLLPGNATEPGSATANAHFILVGAGNIEMGDLTILANATNYDHGKVHADGSVNFDTPTSVSLGDVTIKVAALNLGAGGTGGANASAVFSQGAITDLTVTGLDIEANAASHGGHGAFANAVARMSDSSISIDHDVTVRARAFNGANAANATALAALDLTATSGALALKGGVHVAAIASDAGNGIAEANANVGLFAGSYEVSVTNGIFVGAWANDVEGNAASANAILNVLGDKVTIGEELITFGSANAQSSTHANIGLFVGAFANDGLANGKARSKASANIFASTADGFGNVTIGAAAIVSASAEAERGSANAQARLHVNGADVTFSGGTDRINSEKFSTSYVGVKVVASANDHSDGLAHAVASADIFASDSLTIARRVLDTANAQNPVGNGNAIAHANLVLTALSGDITVSGSVDVYAHAFEGNGEGGVVSAVADASLNAAGDVNVSFDLNESANAHGGAGLNSVVAKAVADLKGLDIRIGYAELDAFASAITAGNVAAVASLNASAPGDIALYGGFGVHATAEALDPDSVTATAEAKLVAGGTVYVGGDVDVTAFASTHGTDDGRARLVEANASLSVVGSEGAFFGTTYHSSGVQHLQEVYGGDITVTANERSHGASTGSAMAKVKLQASTADGLTGGELRIYGNVSVEADAAGGTGAGRCQGDRRNAGRRLPGRSHSPAISVCWAMP